MTNETKLLEYPEDVCERLITANERLAQREVELMAEVERLEADLCQWRDAIQKLTPQGSEYMSIKAVSEFAKQQKLETVQAKLDRARLEKANKAMLTALEEVKQVGNLSVRGLAADAIASAREVQS